MLSNIRNDLVHCLNILEAIEKIFLYSRNCGDAEEFYNLNDQLNFNATLTLLANIGETVGKLSLEIKEKYPAIAWQQIKDFRNRVVHDYHGLDIFIVYDILSSDLRPLEEQIIDIVAIELDNGNFDEQEFEIAKESDYYRHIPFHKFEIQPPTN